MALADEGGHGMSRYKLIIERHQVTLVDTQTGRQESYAENTQHTQPYIS